MGVFQPSFEILIISVYQILRDSYAVLTKK